MSKPKHRKRSRRDRPARPSGRRVPLVAVTVVLAVGVFAGAVLFLRGERGGTDSLPASPAAQRAQAAPITPTAGSGFGTLSGRWLRPDGGYILEIRDIVAGGKIDAVYLNPRPIHVARAEATRDGSALKVFVELRAPGYPGSTYTLTYDPQRDQLAGSISRRPWGRASTWSSSG
jgi:hypothetical protein